MHMFMLAYSFLPFFYYIRFVIHTAFQIKFYMTSIDRYIMELTNIDVLLLEVFF